MPDPQETRREKLKNLKYGGSTHAGLWLDKYYSEFPEAGSPAKDTPKTQLTRQVAKIQPPTEYKLFFERWKQALSDAHAIHLEAKVSGRMVVGLGAESVLETSIALHRTYGVPFIPGSALKGLAAHYARNYLNETDWGKSSPAYKTVFGDTDDAGYVTFFDALLVPPGSERVIYTDVLTSHHQEYYTGKGTAPPADWDSPNPVPFLSVRGTYLIALAGPKEWVDATFVILEKALWELGVGAKTSSGYGRMKLDVPVKPAIAVAPIAQTQATKSQPVSPASDENKVKADKYIQWVQTLTKKTAVQKLADEMVKIEGIAISEPHKMRIREAVWAKLKEHDLLESLEQKQKKWFVGLKEKLGY